MGILDKLLRRKKKQEITTPKGKKPEKTELEKFCGHDKKLYRALYGTMLLDPRKVGVSRKEAVNKAREFEKQGDNLRARVWYDVAGGLAIYEGNVSKVREYFQKCIELSDGKLSKKYGPILEITDRAIEKAQEFYAEHLID